MSCQWLLAGLWLSKQCRAFQLCTLYTLSLLMLGKKAVWLSCQGARRETAGTIRQAAISRLFSALSSATHQQQKCDSKLEIKSGRHFKIKSLILSINNDCFYLLEKGQRPRTKDVLRRLVLFKFIFEHWQCEAKMWGILHAGWRKTTQDTSFYP